jgi:long-chain acyl-CoA synthetase
MVAANFPGARRMGSVGKVVPGVRVVIDSAASPQPDSGEIVVYGPNVMQGYHNRPEENDKVFTADGGLRTGDLGYLDADGYLYITGRIKDQYKLSNGKYVTPGPLEEELKLSRFIAHIMLHGANRPHNVALVALDVAAVREWARQQGFELAEPARDGRVQQLIVSEIRRGSAHFRGYEVPRRVLLTTDEFTTDNDMLTPTLKLKRRNVEHNYGAALEALYEDSQEEITAVFPR